MSMMYAAAQLGGTVEDIFGTQGYKLLSEYIQKEIFSQITLSLSRGPGVEHPAMTTLYGRKQPNAHPDDRSLVREGAKLVFSQYPRIPGA